MKKFPIFPKPKISIPIHIIRISTNIVFGNKRTLIGEDDDDNHISDPEATIAFNLSYPIVILFWNKSFNMVSYRYWSIGFY